MKAARVDREIELSALEGHLVHAGYLEVDAESRMMGARPGNLDRSWRDIEARGVKPMAAKPERGGSCPAADIEDTGARRDVLLSNRSNYPRRGPVREPRHLTVIPTEVPLLPSCEFGGPRCSSRWASSFGHLEPPTL